MSGEKPGKPSFPIVGDGASAGGLEAFKQLLHALPVDTGMGFVLVQHLAPTHASNWVLGCSSGEEAYSIAMTFVEFTQSTGSHVPVHVFATDQEGQQ